MVRNIRGHRIRWSVLFAQGAWAGLIAGLVMLAVAMLSIPLFSDNTGVWSFPRAVASVFLGDNGDSSLSGFALGAVALGLAVHFAISALAGAAYAGICGMFDLEGWTPVAVMGLLFGAILFVWSATFVSVGLTSDTAENSLPLAAMLWGNIAFGLTMGLVLATWAERADLDMLPSERVRAFEGDQPPGELPS